jgi:protein SCO1/2
VKRFSAALPLALALLCLLNHPALAEIPQDSIYHLDSYWLDQDSRRISLQEFAGKKVVLSMVYTSCQHTCPTIVSNMQSIENRLSAEDRSKVLFVLVSLMPDTDSPQTMKAFAKTRGIEEWVLLSGSIEDVRTLAMALNVKYKEAGENEISHSNLITILDIQGRIEHRINGTSADTDSAIAHLP